MVKGLPSPKPGAADVAKLTTGIAAALAALWYPEAALAAPFLPFAIDKFIERPQRILLAALKDGDLSSLTSEQAAEFVPMAYRYMEAAKQGEYERTLKVLAAFIAGETGAAIPEAGNFARMARRLEGLTEDELRLIALIADMMGPPRDWLGNASYNLKEILDRALGADYWPTNLAAARPFREALHELGARGFLLTNESPLIGGTQTSFEPTECLRELLDKAGIAIKADNP